MRTSVWAVGIELRVTLKARESLIPLIAKNAKKSEFAQVRYTAGTRSWENMDPGGVLRVFVEHLDDSGDAHLLNEIFHCVQRNWCARRDSNSRAFGS